jgi:hypothetical protein
VFRGGILHTSLLSIPIASEVEIFMFFFTRLRPRLFRGGLLHTFYHPMCSEVEFQCSVVEFQCSKVEFFIVFLLSIPYVFRDGIFMFRIVHVFKVYPHVFRGGILQSFFCRSLMCSMISNNVQNWA